MSTICSYLLYIFGRLRANYKTNSLDVVWHILTWKPVKWLLLGKCRTTNKHYVHVKKSNMAKNNNKATLKYQSFTSNSCPDEVARKPSALLRWSLKHYLSFPPSFRIKHTALEVLKQFKVDYVKAQFINFKMLLFVTFQCLIVIKLYVKWALDGSLFEWKTLDFSHGT